MISEEQSLRFTYVQHLPLHKGGGGETWSVALSFTGRGRGRFVNVMLATQANALGKAEGSRHLRVVAYPCRGGVAPPVCGSWIAFSPTASRMPHEERT